MPEDRPHRSRRARLLLAALTVLAAAALTATLASGALKRSAFYNCPPAGTPTVSVNGWTSLTRSATVMSTTDPNGAPTVVTYGTTAFLETKLTGANNDLIFEGHTITSDDNKIAVQYVDPGSINAPFSVNVSNTSITVHLATDAGKNIVTTANQIATAIAANPAAALLVTVLNASGNDGSGVVTAMEKANLANGGVSTVQTAVAPGSAQSATLTLETLSPDTRYLVTITAVNSCPTANTASANVFVDTRAEAGINLIGTWGSAPTSSTASISGQVVVAPDAGGTGSGPSDTSVTCDGTTAWLDTLAVGTPIDLASCPVPFASGASVTLTASNPVDTYFSGWTGTDCSPWGLQPVCYATAVGALDESATFSNRPSLAVTFGGSGDGTVTSTPIGLNCTSLSPSCSAIFAPKQTVLLTVAPAPGNTFLGWGGDALSCGVSMTCSVTMTKSVAASVTFGGRPTLYVFRAGNGGGTVTSQQKEISCGGLNPVCSAKFDAGTKVTLTANPGPNSTFAGWGSDAADCSGTSTTCTVTALFSESVTAIFSDGHTLTITPSGTGTGTVTSSPSGISCPPDCSSVFPEGSEVTLNTLAGSGSTFDGWDDGPCFDRDASVPCAITLVDDMELPVVFDNPSSALAGSAAKSSFKGCTIVGTARNDVLVGRGHDVVCGGGGNDTLIGTGNDVLLGGAGNDKLSCTGSCKMYGGAGNDTLLARGGGLSQLFGGPGNDLLLARNNVRNLVDGGAGKNRARFDKRIDQLKRVQVKLTK